MPRYPDDFYDFFKKILQVSPRLRMDCQEFFEHPMFNYTGNEPDFFSNTRKKKENGETDKNGISSRETGVENDSVKENNHLDSNMFKMHRETY